MPLEEFWYDDCDLIFAYSRAYENRLNYTAWINGLYIYSAVNSSIGAMLTKKGKKSPQYPNKPLDFNELAKDVELKTNPDKREEEYVNRIKEWI